MLRQELLELIAKEPFEPFRITLVNGQIQNIFHPQNVTVAKTTVSVTPPDQTWIIFPIDKIASVEALMEDFHGQAPV
jgi:hypothetical protein